MTTVLIEGGRTYTLESPHGGDTVGMLADAIAVDYYGPHDGDRVHSFKVDGTVIHPDTLVGQVALHDQATVELVDVTDHTWTQDAHGMTVDLDETGSVVDAAGLHHDVPAGTVDDVRDWVGDDLVRAKAALAVEELQDHPRTTLIEHLHEHFGDDLDDDNADA